MSIKNLQLSFKLNEHRYAPTVRWVRAALEAIKRAFGVNDFSKIMGRNVAFVAPLPSIVELRQHSYSRQTFVSFVLKQGKFDESSGKFSTM